MTNNTFNSKIPFSSFFPLYLSPSESREVSLEEKLQRISTLSPEIISSIEANLQLSFLTENQAASNVCMANSEEVRDDFKTVFAPIDLLDYMYAILHTGYREKPEQLPKAASIEVPYPKDSGTFWPLVRLGSKLRQLHTLESPLMTKSTPGFPKDGDNVITAENGQNNRRYESTSETHGRVWINEQQYFEQVPLPAWNCCIGGFTPAREWLRERQGRKLSSGDIFHYQKMIVALTETDRLIREI